jgi:KH domain
MNKGHDVPNVQSDGHFTTEILIPGNKAGIVIGKGGETIKQLQVDLNCVYYCSPVETISAKQFNCASCERIIIIFATTDTSFSVEYVLSKGFLFCKHGHQMIPAIILG